MAKSNTKKAVVDTSDKTPEEKQKALETAISQIEKSFGKGTIIKMGENPKMVLDLSRMSHIDSSGLGMLVKLLQRATDKGGVVKIACLQSHPRIVFDITKAYRVFEIYDSVDAALKSF